MILKDEQIHPPLTTWECFVGLVENKLTKNKQTEDEWIFRGMGNPWQCENFKTVEILSSFDKACQRKTISVDDPCLNEEQRVLLEALMLFEFKREVKNYLSVVPAQENFLEWMALARHYGTPSRLVDFSYSPFVAAYFALAEKQNKESGWVIAINLTKLKDATETLLSSKRWFKVGEKNATFHLPAVFHSFAFKSKPLFTAPVNPCQRNPRLAAQQGLFLCPGDVGKSFNDNLAETLKEIKDGILLIELTHRMRTEAIHQLGRMNIGGATLYRDLTGWAQSQGDLVHETKRLEEKRLRFVLKMSSERDPKIP